MRKSLILSICPDAPDPCKIPVDKICSGGGYNDFNDVSHREARFTPVQAKCRPAAQTESKQQQKGKMDVKSNGFSSRRAARASE